MPKHLIDRLTDTTTFRVLLFVSALFVLPVLALGFFYTPLLLSMSVSDGERLDVFAFAGLSLGGAVGVTGWMVAIVAARSPERHNLIATILCLVIGVVTALAVTGSLIVMTVERFGDPWGGGRWAIAPVAFAGGTAIWAIGGVGRIQRLARVYRERTGRTFDGIPVVMLVVVVGLVAAFVAGLATL
jgi:hypothetical protein